MVTTNDIRTTFLDYFEKRDHKVVISGPLVPRNDPTLLFTNAGMVQFKHIFTGQENCTYKRMTSAQKCIRAGGKHNDLDKVGYTSRHHTFFEMLGNFSFGDYFKEIAIVLAWDLMTKEFSLPAERFVVTVHDSDEDAAALWKKISGLPDTRIIRITTADNFWQMGETGPCGPCSELFYDHGSHLSGGLPGSAGAEGDRFVEVWNLVFMQFEQLVSGERVLLPQPSIDTGMGLERIAAVLQGHSDTYSTDLLRIIIETAAHTTYTEPDGLYRIEHRVIADHIRSIGFLIADGVLPSNEGRGHVLRRIMRRAMRHAYKISTETPFLWKLIPVLVEQMGVAYPELRQAEALVVESLKQEEERFRETLERGLKLLDEQTENMRPGDVLSGEAAFKLYDTYGFPLDMTQVILQGRSLTVDSDGFNTAVAHQRDVARGTWVGSGEVTVETLWFELKGRVGTTEFLGYDCEDAEGFLIALIVDGKLVDQAEVGTTVMLLANRTPFYAESGGQVGDTGIITVINNRGQVIISNTLKKFDSIHVHIGRVKEGKIKLGDAAYFSVNQARRAALCIHHSATHLLHAALHRILGRNVTQRGSLVAPDHLRLDISYPKALTKEELRAVEVLVNHQIWANKPVSSCYMQLSEAIQSGAIALFEEKYSDEVRVVTMGGVGIGVGGSKNFSIELCGGTHVQRTGDIGLLHIVHESSVATGVRRIEAVGGQIAEELYSRQAQCLIQTANILKTTKEAVPDRVSKLLEEKHNLELEVVDIRRKLLVGSNRKDRLAHNSIIKKIAGITFVTQQVENVATRDLKGLIDSLKHQLMGPGVIVVISITGHKVSLVAGVTDDLTWQISAVDLVQIGAKALGGKGGGGRPDLAQTGGSNPDAVTTALQVIEQLLRERIQLLSTTQEESDFSLTLPIVE